MRKDRYNQKFLEEIFPNDRQNPKAAPFYDLVVVGAGPGGMTAAMLASQNNLKVALIEKEHMGGECLSAGCIPSKAMLRCSKFIDEVENANEFGIEIPQGWSINFQKIMERVRRLRSNISEEDSVEKFQKMGIDIFLGTGQFITPEVIEVAGQPIHFKKAFIAPGTEPLLPKIEGIEEVDCLTNRTVFDLVELPKRFAFVGAGPIGCELAQAFLRFGSEVTLITHGPRMLSNEDKTAAERLRKVFEAKGMRLLFNHKIQKLAKSGKEKLIYFEGQSEPLIVDEIMMGIGRVPAVAGYGLEKANIKADLKNGILVNDLLQTSNPNIYSIGDLQYKFTHVSKEHAHMAVKNAFKNGNLKKSDLVMAWCTYTDPEIAHVGMNEQDAAKNGISIDTFQFELANNIRANLDGETNGFFKIHVKEGSDQIVGATLMAHHAGEMISEVTVAITGQLGLLGLIKAIHPFPTQAEAIRMAAELLLKKNLIHINN